MGLLKASLKLSIPLSPVQIVKVVGSQSDKYMISYFGNFSGLGVYDIALKLGNLSFVLIPRYKMSFLLKYINNFLK